MECNENLPDYMLQTLMAFEAIEIGELYWMLDNGVPVVVMYLGRHNGGSQICNALILLGDKLRVCLPQNLWLVTEENKSTGYPKVFPTYSVHATSYSY